MYLEEKVIGTFKKLYLDIPQLFVIPTNKTVSDNRLPKAQGQTAPSICLAAPHLRVGTWPSSVKETQGQVSLGFWRILPRAQWGESSFTTAHFASCCGFGRSFGEMILSCGSRFATRRLAEQMDLSKSWWHFGCHPTPERFISRLLVTCDNYTSWLLMPPSAWLPVILMLLILYRASLLSGTKWVNFMFTLI